MYIWKHLQQRATAMFQKGNYYNEILPISIIKHKTSYMSCMLLLRQQQRNYKPNSSVSEMRYKRKRIFLNKYPAIFTDKSRKKEVVTKDIFHGVA
jgi:hypothetical protein